MVLTIVPIILIIAHKKLQSLQNISPDDMYNDSSNKLIMIVMLPYLGIVSMMLEYLKITIL